MPCRGGCAHCRGESCRAQRSWALWVAARRERARLRAREEVREVVGVKGEGEYQTGTNHHQ